ncbi:MAG: hypothetical protein ABIN91_04245 [Mucilaginibacter sp.]|uniref:hypothetical protein n=1 Tax=Mucilaginibacter sp. TaxID=1882438 RepID=UPI0032634303
MIGGKRANTGKRHQDTSADPRCFPAALFLPTGQDSRVQAGRIWPNGLIHLNDF